MFKTKFLQGQSTEQRDRLLFDQISLKYAKKDLVPSSKIAREYQLNSAIKLAFKKKKNIGFVVDVGCGFGASASYLKGKYQGFLGIDQSKKEIDLAKKFHFQEKNVKFLAKNIKHVRLNKKADVVLSLGALHHMTDLDEVVEILKKNARSKATLLILEPQKSNIFIATLRNARKKIDPAYSADQIYFEEKYLTDVLNQHGFTNIKADFQGFFSPYFAQVVLPPQFLTKHLSFWATRIDEALNRMPKSIKKLFSFNIVIVAKFPKK